MGQSRYCNKCRRTIDEKNFYTYRDGSKCELCKACLTMHVNNFDPSTFMWLLEKFDVPYIESEWNTLRDRAYAKDPYKMTGMTVFGKYLAKMKLKQWNDYRWADTERLKIEAEEKAKLYGQPQDIAQQKIEEMEKAYENGEITEAQYLTYKEINTPEVNPEVTNAENFKAGGGGQGSPYPVNNNEFEVVELPDVGNELTDEDKIYLAMKWGRLYRPDEWVALEQKYNDFMNSFDIQGAARIDTLKHICKTSLKMDQSIDCGDVESYQKLSRVYTTLMKDAKFTEAQRKEEKSGDFDAVGQIVFFAEKEGGRIPRYEIDTPLDKVDQAILDLKKYNHDLIVNDPSISQMLENLIKRRESAASQKEDMRKAEAEGLDYVPLTDEDFEEFNKLLEERGLNSANELEEEE